TRQRGGPRLTRPPQPRPPCTLSTPSPFPTGRTGCLTATSSSTRLTPRFTIAEIPRPALGRSHRSRPPLPPPLPPSFPPPFPPRPWRKRRAPFICSEPGRADSSATGDPAAPFSESRAGEGAAGGGHGAGQGLSSPGLSFFLPQCDRRDGGLGRGARRLPGARLCMYWGARGRRESPGLRPPAGQGWIWTQARPC
uniref:Uncharacterized protein n=1 Tax=Catharus ustulatus TaxID=91951 RepID=A0A8C3V491_CATUS